MSLTSVSNQLLTLKKKPDVDEHMSLGSDSIPSQDLVNLRNLKIQQPKNNNSSILSMLNKSKRYEMLHIDSISP